MLSRMAFVPAFAVHSTVRRPNIEVHRLGIHQPFALRSIYNPPPIQGRATMSHRLSSDRRPVSLSMLSLNVNSLLNLLVKLSYRGFALQTAA